MSVASSTGPRCVGLITLRDVNALADWLIDVIKSVPTWAVYVITAAVVYSETAILLAGLIMPSEALLLAAGVAAAVGPANVGWLIVVVAVCAVSGDITGYWCGRSGGTRLMHSRLGRRFGEQRWESAMTRIHDSGPVVVMTGRWVGYVRTIVPRVAGMSHMEPMRFVLADIVGATTWVTTVLLAGYFAGAVLGATILLYAVVGLVVLAAAYYTFRWWRGRSVAA